MADDPKFATNPARLMNRDDMNRVLIPLLATHSINDIVAALEARKIPVGPVNTLNRVFASDQVAARDMKIDLPSASSRSGAVTLIGNPLKFSKTPVTYRSAPPVLGQDTDDILFTLSETIKNDRHH